MATNRPSFPEEVLGAACPGLPIVLCGASGSGRTVLCLQQVHALLARGESVAFLTAEPPRLLLRQAASLGLSLDAGVCSGRRISRTGSSAYAGSASSSVCPRPSSPWRPPPPTPSTR